MDKKKQAWILAFVLIAGLAYFFYNAGNYLVREDRLVRSDFIVVLMGSGPDRLLEAVDLYKAGYSKKIVMVVNHRPGDQLLKSRNVSIPSDPDLNKSVGVQLGVPSAAFVILPCGADSTWDEARRIEQYLQTNPGSESMILVSSRYHTTRAGIIFERTLKTDEQQYRVTVCPSRYDTFNEKAWWRSREDIERVIAEYIKLAALFTVER